MDYTIKGLKAKIAKDFEEAYAKGQIEGKKIYAEQMKQFREEQNENQN